VQADAHRAGSGTDDRSDLIECKAGPEAQRQQVLLLGVEQPDHRTQPFGTFVGQKPLLEIRLGPGGIVVKRLPHRLR
jgi:hypothetical protein